MLGVFQACSVPDDTHLPRDIAAPSLEEAIAALAEDGAPGADLARLRALTHLLGAQVQDRAAYCHCMDRLERAVIMDKSKRAAAQRTVRGGPRKFAPPAAGTLLKAATGTRGSRARLAVLSQLIPEADRRRFPDVNVQSDPRTLVSKVTGTVDVKAKPRELAAMIDPRRWKEFNPIFRVSDPVESPRGNEPGKDWSGVLYEDVVFEMNDSTTGRFENLLNVSFTVKDERSRTNYGLYRAITSQIWLLGRPGGIDVNRGFWEARALGDGWTQMKVLKELRFTDATPRDTGSLGPWDFGHTMNYMAPAILGMWIDALLSAAAELSDAWSTATAPPLAS